MGGVVNITAGGGGIIMGLGFRCASAVEPEKQASTKNKMKIKFFTSLMYS
jgi:hypothetical protein